MNRRLRKLNEKEFKNTQKVRVKQNIRKVLKELEEESKSNN